MAEEIVERLVLEPGSPWWGEHRSRYRLAVPYVAGRRVLDVACGSGFGGPILLDGGATAVLGVDLAEEALEAAAPNRRPRFALTRADGTRLPLPDDSVDVITSFETVEHVPDADDFLRELHRVLRDDGVLLLSTPNAVFTKPVNGTPRNPFHFREYLPGELTDLLARHFADVRVFGQVVSDEYGLSPFWVDPARWPRRGRAGLEILAWRVLHRVGGAVGAAGSRAVLRRPLHPGDDDFALSDDPDDVHHAHALVAVCRP